MSIGSPMSNAPMRPSESEYAIAFQLVGDAWQ